MNKHYENASAALRETDSLGIATEATAMGSMQTQATLAVAVEQARTNQQLELGNLIAYAQLHRARRRPSLVIEDVLDIRMADAFPELKEAIFGDDDNDLDL